MFLLIKIVFIEKNVANQKLKEKFSTYKHNLLFLSSTFYEFSYLKIIAIMKRK